MTTTERSRPSLVRDVPHRDGLWRAVDGLVDRAATLEDLRAHRLHLLAARRWRASGRDVPTALASDEFTSALVFAAAKTTLARARAAYDGGLLVLKGPHTASFYPSPQLRPFSDVDLLAADPRRAHAALVADGFEPIGFADEYYLGLHHLRPLLNPEQRIVVEIHRFPNWLAWATPPSAQELFADALPDALGITGLAGLSPEHHAAVLAVHSWVELPFRRISDLVDVAAVAEVGDRRAIAAVARRWQVQRVWHTTIASADALLGDGSVPLAMRACAPNFLSVRDRTVQETHLRRLIAPFWARRAPEAVGDFSRGLVRTLLPAPSDTWSTKLSRAGHALRRRSAPSAEHADLLGPADAHRAPHMRRRHETS